METEINQAYSDAILFIMKHRNGETVDLLKKWGTSYNMTYGVSFADILAFVRNKPKNTLLARRLWKEEIRETKLMSFHFFAPNEISETEIESMISQFNHQEMFEQATLYLIVHAPFASQKALEWVASDSFNFKNCGYLLLLRLASKRKELSADYYKQFFEKMQIDASSENIFIRKSITSALIAIAAISADNKQAVAQFVESLQNENSDFARCVAVSVADELQYL